MFSGILAESCKKESSSEETCSCGRYMQNIQECTELLGKRVAAAVSKEVEQYRMSMELGAARIQERNSPFWNRDSRLNEDVKPPTTSMSPSSLHIKLILLDMLTDVNAILLDCLE